LFAHHTNDLHKKLAADLVVRPGMRVLDLGCGNGASLPALFEALAGNGVVTAVDRNEESLKAVRASFSEAEYNGRLECKAVDLSSPPLPFDDGIFDRIICQNVIECITDKVGLLNECCRILKPGGRCLVSHHDFDTAVFNSSYIALTRQLVHDFADTTQQWQDTSDGQIGRKISGLFSTSSFGEPLDRGTLIIDEYSYAPDNYGYNFSQWTVDIATKNGNIPTNDLNLWQQDLAGKAEAGDYYFGICLMAAVGEK